MPRPAVRGIEVERVDPPLQRPHNGVRAHRLVGPEVARVQGDSASGSGVTNDEPGSHRQVGEKEGYIYFSFVIQLPTSTTGDSSSSTEHIEGGGASGTMLLWFLGEGSTTQGGRAPLRPLSSCPDRRHNTAAITVYIDKTT